MPNIPELKLEPDHSLAERYQHAQAWYFDLCDKVRTVPQEGRGAFCEKIRQRLGEAVPAQNRFATDQGSEYYAIGEESPNGPKVMIRVKSTAAGLLGKVQEPTILLGFIGEAQRNEIIRYAMLNVSEKDVHNGAAFKVDTRESGRTFTFKGVNPRPQTGAMPLEFTARRGNFPRIEIDPKAGTASLEYSNHEQPGLHVGNKVKEIGF